MSDRSTLLLEHHLKAAQAAQLSERIRQDGGPVRRQGRRPSPIPAQAGRAGAHRPPPADGGAPDSTAPPASQRSKSVDTFDFLAIPSVNKALMMELARCEYVERRENVIAVGNSGTGKTQHRPRFELGRLPAWDVRGLHHRHHPGLVTTS